MSLTEVSPSSRPLFLPAALALKRATSLGKRMLGAAQRSEKYVPASRKAKVKAFLHCNNFCFQSPLDILSRPPTKCTEDDPHLSWRWDDWEMERGLEPVWYQQLLPCTPGLSPFLERCRDVRAACGETPFSDSQFELHSYTLFCGPELRRTPQMWCLGMDPRQLMKFTFWLVLMPLSSSSQLDLPFGSDTWSSATISPKLNTRQHPFETVRAGECRPRLRGCENLASPHSILFALGSDSLLACSAWSGCLGVPQIHHIWNVQLLQAARSLGVPLGCCIWKWFGIQKGCKSRKLWSVVLYFWPPTFWA